MKKSNLTLFLVFLIIISFFLWLSWRNENRDYTPVPQETIKIKEAPVIDYKKYDNDKGK